MNISMLILILLLHYYSNSPEVYLNTTVFIRQEKDFNNSGNSILSYTKIVSNIVIIYCAGLQHVSCYYIVGIVFR